jgi:hypothetical protein
VSLMDGVDSQDDLGSVQLSSGANPQYSPGVALRLLSRETAPLRSAGRRAYASRGLYTAVYPCAVTLDVNIPNVYIKKFSPNGKVGCPGRLLRGELPQTGPDSCGRTRGRTKVEPLRLGERASRTDLLLSRVVRKQRTDCVPLGWPTLE